MSNLREFRKVNNLTQDQLGEYLGIKKSFLSGIETGRSKLPPEKFAKLLANDQGWDTSMLAATYNNTTQRVSGSDNTAVVGGNVVRIGNISGSTDGEGKGHDALRAENDLLRSENESLRRQNERLLEIVAAAMGAGK